MRDNTFRSIALTREFWPNIRLNLAAYEAANRNVVRQRELEAVIRGGHYHNSQRLGKAEIERAIDEQYNLNIPYFKSLNRTNFDQLPKTNKTQIVGCEQKFINKSILTQNLWVKSTSASSGPSLQVLYSEEFYVDELYLSVPKIAADNSTKCFKGRLSVNISDTANRAGAIFLHPYNEIGLQVDIPIDFRNEREINLLVKFLKAYQPKIICSRPEILHLLIMLDRKSRLLGTCQLIICSGSHLSDERRELIEKHFSVKVVNTYASTEFGIIAWEHEKSNLMHLDTSRIVAEISTTTANELVLSSISNSAMPLIRYQTSDIITTHHRTNQNLSFRLDTEREIPLFWTNNTQPYLPTYYHASLTKNGIWDYSIHQPEVGSIEIHTNSYENESRIYRALEEAEINLAPSRKSLKRRDTKSLDRRYISHI